MKMREESELRDDQLFIASIIETEPAKLIVAPMGRGKTGAFLTGLKRLLDAGKVSHAMIIAPKFVAQNTWSDEIAAWAHLNDIEYRVCVGTDKERKAALAAKPRVLIINKDVLPWLAKEIGTVKNWIWDFLGIDEMSMFKAGEKRTKRARVKKKVGEIWHVVDEVMNEVLSGDEEFPSAAEAQAWIEGMEALYAILDDRPFETALDVTPAKRGDKIGVVVRKGGNMTRFGVLTTARKKIHRIYGLTGTPAPNGVEDLWGQIYLLDQGVRLGRTKKDFLDRWFIVDKYSHETKPRPGAAEEIMAAISDIMVSLPPLDLVPPPIYIPVRVTLPPKVMQEYRTFEKSLVSQTYDVEAVSKGVLANKLLQFANSSMYREDGTAVLIHTEKLDALDELIERAAGDPVLVFYGFKFDLAEIRKRHPDAVVLNESETAIKDWNNGKIRILLAHPASCAHGLNLQYGGHICIWFGLTWSLELYLQANARLPRPGQKHLVAIYQIIAADTYDENALDVLSRKEVTQDMVIESVLHRIGKT